METSLQISPKNVNLKKNNIGYEKNKEYFYYPPHIMNGEYRH